MKVRQVNDLPKYARMEIERRWLVDASAVCEVTDAPYRLIEDLYVTGSRLRLRKITDPSGNALFKFGKKYGKRSPLSEPVTTLYLSEVEYQQLARVAGFGASKRRYAIAGGSLDVYQRPRPGLMIFELEFDDEAAARRFRPPDFVTQEITGDAAFSGFALARGAGVE